MNVFIFNFDKLFNKKSNNFDNFQYFYKLKLIIK